MLCYMGEAVGYQIEFYVEEMSNGINDELIWPKKHIKMSQYESYCLRFKD